MSGTVDLSRVLRVRNGDAGRLKITPEVFRQQPGPADAAPLTRNIFPPWVYKLPMSKDYNQNLFSSILAAGAGSVVTPVSFTLPKTYVGWEQIFGIYVLTPTALTDITFSLQINDAPVEGWDNVRIPPGVANFVVQNFSDLQVKVPNGGRVSVVVTNNSAAGPWTVGAKIAGWYHPELEEQRIYGSL